MSKSKQTQADLMDYTADVVEKPITETVVCKLETSASKNEYIKKAIDEWQPMLAYAYDVLPSFDKNQWTGSPTGNTQLRRRIVDEFPDSNLLAAVKYEAGYKAAGMFSSWEGNGGGDNYPRPQNDSYICLSASGGKCPKIIPNDRGYGLRIKLRSYEDPIWFHIDAGNYQRQYLERVCDDDHEYSLGGGELHFRNGNLYAHLHISWSVDVYRKPDVGRWVGVDRGMNALYAAAVVESNGDVAAADVQTGDEYFHHRSRIEQKKDELQRKGSLKKAKAQGLYERYTDQMIHECSRAVVDLADKHRPCGIALEDLTHARETSGGKFHEFPYGMLHEKISYKAKEKGIPIKDVNPHNTSIECRMCEQDNDANREWGDATAFQCRLCGYEVHADVNAAINIAKRAK